MSVAPAPTSIQVNDEESGINRQATGTDRDGLPDIRSPEPCLFPPIRGAEPAAPKIEDEIALNLRVPAGVSNMT